MNEQHIKDKIIQSLKNLSAGNPGEKVEALFQTLGYSTQRKFDLGNNEPEDFLDQWEGIDRQRAMSSEWISVDFLFQLTEEEIRANPQLGLFNQIDLDYLKSYLFLSIGLRENYYTRTQLSNITREVNRKSDIPIMVLFRHGEYFTLSIINRRPHKRETSKDILEKITLIKDISIANPHRAHLEIFFDLSLPQLYKEYQFTNFDQLHDAWQKTLDTSELNKRFFKEVSNWYFWAVQNVTFPEGAGEEVEIRNATSVIRLITRLIFVWFLKEKKLVPDDLFNYRRVQQFLKSTAPEESTYYKAILQNLFFATLNQEMNTPSKPDNRKFRNKAKQAGGRDQASTRLWRDQNYMIHNVYRYENYFLDSQTILREFENIPFLNGGLFECLDKENPDNSKQIIRIDGFSDRQDNPLSVPNFLFFTESDQQVDLNDIYGTRNKRYTVRGLINIFNSYKFTITENTPIEEEIALDPELLGKVFENLLAAYNPETNTTARKQTGSFYTPREIVDYMVDEALIADLEGKLSSLSSGERGINERLRHLFAYNNELHQFTEQRVEVLIEAIDNLKILDPACGSGAFPMGILHKLVFILSKLDPQNRRWKEKQIAKANEIPDSTIREKVIEDIEQAFERNQLDYGRKLYLIENCIYGVDIQPIAVQISKLRCFISLIVDQNIDDEQENRGIRPLPNLETKFVAANALIGIKGAADFTLRDPRIEQNEKKLAEVRRSYFIARTPKTKAKYRDLDNQIRNQISEILKSDGFPSESAEKLASWNPYAQNAFADFFDAEWMFGLSDGFDICIGNPPYVRQEQIKEFKLIFKNQYDCYTGVADLYVYFYEQGLKLLKNKGILCYISSNKYFRSGYGEKLRKFLANQSTIYQLIDFGDAPVFTAIAYPSIMVASKEQTKNHQTRVLNWQLGQPVNQFASVFEDDSFLMPQKELTADGWRLESNSVLRLLEKLRQAGKPLGEYVNGRFYYGIKTGFNEAFIVDRETRDRLIAEHPSSSEVLKPFLRGKDVKRWRVNFCEQYLIKIESSENKQHPWSGKSAKEAEKIFAKTYPAIHARFDEFREQLSRRSDQGKFFWELRSCVYWQEFEQPKIIYPDIAIRCEFAFDHNALYPDCTLFLIPSDSKYLLGFLNSGIIEFFINQICPAVRGDFRRFKSIYVSKIPIPTATTLELQATESLVDKILTAKSANPNADVSKLEAEIDQLVYQLYELTPEEIAIVEEATNNR